MSEFNAAQRKHIRAAEKEAKLASEQNRATISSLMSTIAGRRWIYDLLLGCHIFNASFQANPYYTAFAEGERNIGLKVFGDVVAFCPDEYVLMMREANERSITSNARRERNSADADGGDSPSAGGDDSAEDTGDDTGDTSGT